MGVPTYQELVDEVMDTVRDATFDTPAVACQGTITIVGGLLPSVSDTITINSDTWTFKTARSAAFEVTIGANADACVANIATAINTDSAVVTAAASTSADTVVVTSVYKGRSFGAAGRSWDGMVFTESASNLTMDGSGLLGTTTAGVFGDRTKTAVNDAMKYVAGQVNLPELYTFKDLVAGSIYVLASTISFTASTSTISDSASGLGVFSAGMSIVIAGAGEADNNQVTRVLSVASGGGSMVVDGILTDEDVGEEIVIATDCVLLPTDLQKPIYKARNVSLEIPIEFYRSLASLHSHFPYIHMRGSVYGVAIRGQYLHFEYIPYTIDDDVEAREMIRVYYYKFPTALSAMEDTPDCFPLETEHLVKPLLVNYAVKEILTKVFKEDVEGGHQIIGLYEGRFAKAMGDLKYFIGPDDAGWDSFSA